MRFSIKKWLGHCSPKKMVLLDSSKARSGTFILDSSCWYDRTKEGSHINKLVGVGCDLFNHYSYCLGWRPSFEMGMFEIIVYLHIDGKWVRSPRLKDDIISVVNGDVMHTFGFNHEEDMLQLLVNGIMVSRHFPFSKGMGWFIQFYYGGKPVICMI